MLCQQRCADMVSTPRPPIKLYVFRPSGRMKTNCDSSNHCEASCNLTTDTMSNSDGQAPYCAVYRYASSSTGYGCAVMTGYTRSVLVTTTSGVNHDPFGSSGSTTSSSTAMQTTSTSASTGSSAHASSTTPTETQTGAPASNSLGGGGIAGIVVGGLVAIAIITVTIWAVVRRRQAKRLQRQSSSTYPSTIAPYTGQEQMTDYTRSSQGYSSPPMSPPLFSFATPKPLSYPGGYASVAPPESTQPFSPESLGQSTPYIPFAGLVGLSSAETHARAGSIPAELSSDGREPSLT